MFNDSIGLIYPRMWNQSSAAVVVLDASGEKLGFIFRVGKTGNIEKIKFRLGNVTTGQTLKASLQNVDLANGEPDETEDQSGTVAVADGDDGDWKEVTLSSVRAVTAGDVLAAVVEFDSTVGDLELWTLALNESLIAYPSHKTGGTWSHLVDAPLLVLTYDDGNSYFTPGVMPGVISTSTFNNTDTPDERAAIFTNFPWPAICIGAIGNIEFDGDCDIVLYEGTTALATSSLDKDVRVGDFHSETMVIFPSEITLDRGSTYYLALKPTSATDTKLRNMFSNIAGDLDMLEGGSNIHAATRTDAGDWTPATNQRISVALILKSIGAMQVHPGMTGGMNG